jgi:fructose-1,6-bisphosphatase/inositol monophosphatase family enzyme
MVVGACQYFPPPLNADVGFRRERCAVSGALSSPKLGLVIRAERGASAWVNHAYPIKTHTPDL